MNNDHDMQQFRDQLDLLVRYYMQANYCGSTSATDAVALDLLKKLRETERMLEEVDDTLIRVIEGTERACGNYSITLQLHPVAQEDYQAALARQSARQAVAKKSQEAAGEVG